MRFILSLSLIIALFGLNDAVLHKINHEKVRRLVSKASKKRTFVSNHKRKLEDGGGGIFDGFVEMLGNVVANAPPVIQNLTSEFAPIVNNFTGLQDLGESLLNNFNNLTGFNLTNFTDEVDFSLFSDELDELTTTLENSLENLTMLENVTDMLNLDFENFDMCTMMTSFGDMDDMIEGDNGEMLEANLECDTNCVDNVMDIACSTECSLCSDVGGTMCVILSTESLSDMGNMIDPMVNTVSKYQYTKGEVGTVNVNVSVTTNYGATDGTCIISYTSLDGTEIECNSCELCEGGDAFLEDSLPYVANCANIDSSATNINLCEPEGATFPGVFRVLDVGEEEVGYVDCSLKAITNAPTIPATEEKATAASETETMDETPTEGETETMDETPAEGETETMDETPAEGETEAMDETPAEGETEAMDETPAEDETETMDETPAEDETETMDEKPAEGETETMDETPAEEESDESTSVEGDDSGAGAILFYGIATISTVISTTMTLF